MDLKNNIEEQRKYLENNLEQLNTVISAILGYKTVLQIEENVCRNTTYFCVVDNRNIKEKCGIMAKAFTDVKIMSFDMFWSDDGVFIELCFKYQHLDGGTNCANFCDVKIMENFVTIV